MKKTFFIGALALSLAGAIGSMAVASTTISAPATTVTETSAPSLSSVLKTLKDQSFTVLKIEREDDGFEAKVISPEGFMREIEFDHAGKVLPGKHPEPKISMAAAIEILQKAGYTSVSSIKVTHHGLYEIEALNPADNKEVEIAVNAITGEIKADHDWF
ncbi:MAG: PepSY domain-containing protein [Gammaproteobacteria bacterium]|nr:PepSY domain-containing protein [Gammaproteobacteria bacterium]